MSRKIIVGTAMSVVISACASSGVTEPITNQSKTNKVVSSLGFVEIENESLLHGGTGLVCPSALMDLPRISKKEYGNEHKDASCGYKQGDKTATIFLSDLPYSFEEAFAGAVAAIQQFPPGGQKIEHDDNARSACLLGGLLISATEPESGRANSAPYRLEAAVFNGDTVTTLVQMSELDKKKLKLRYTVQNSNHEAALDHCLQGAKALREVYNLSGAHNNN